MPNFQFQEPESNGGAIRVLYTLLGVGIGAIIGGSAAFVSAAGSIAPVAAVIGSGVIGGIVSFLLYDHSQNGHSQSPTHRDAQWSIGAIDAKKEHPQRLEYLPRRVGIVVIGMLIVAVAAGTAVSSLLGENIVRPELWFAATLMVSLAAICLAAFSTHLNRTRSKKETEYTEATRTFAEEYERYNKKYPKNTAKK